MSLKKHINTKQPPQDYEVTNNAELDDIERNYCFEGIEDIEDMFQLEIVEDEQVFVMYVVRDLTNMTK